MKFTLSICPTTPTSNMSGWYILNTYLQKELDIAMNIAVFDDFESQRLALQNGEIDFVYANPYDATLLIRDLGFSALNKPKAQANEVVIVCKNNSNLNTLSDLNPGIKIATTNDPAINLIAMMLLEAADINDNNSQLLDCSSYIIAAKNILKDEADIAFLPKSVYDNLSNIIKDQLQPLISSEISVIHHIFAASEKSKDRHVQISEVLCQLNNSDAGKNILASIGISAFDTIDQEEAEFMIDLIDTLQ